MKQLGALLVLLCVSPAVPAQTKTSFDKFKNKTHFITKETATTKVTYDGGKDASLLIHRMGMVVGFVCEGQVESCRPPQVELLFIGYTSDWTMNGNKEVNLLMDGKSERAGRADWDGQVLSADNLVEYNDVMISPELLTRLAES